MKFKLFFIFILSAILIAYLIWASMSPKYSTIQFTSIVNAPQNLVYPEVANLNRWANWVSFMEKDPTMHLLMLNIGGNSEQGIQWDGKENLTGNGKLKLISSINNYKFNYELNLNSPIKSKLNGEIQIQIKSYISSNISIMNKEEISFLKRPLSQWFNHSEIIIKEWKRSLARLDSICTIKSNDMYLKEQSSNIIAN